MNTNLIYYFAIGGIFAIASLIFYCLSKRADRAEFRANLRIFQEVQAKTKTGFQKSTILNLYPDFVFVQLEDGKFNYVKITNIYPL
jgi:hypothetical protein